MSTLIRGTNSYFMGAQAFLLDDSEREIASDWASKHVTHNPALKWILGRFVEANQANNNKQAWSLEDLRLKQPTINHAPMNMVHQARHIVGAYVATEMLYPVENAASGEPTNPHVEALGAFWRYYFPEEYQAVQKAHDEGALYFSMECVAESIKFESAAGETQTFPYAGPFSETYGDWNKDREATRWLNNPHFLAGALIVPPVKPGWSNATIKSLSQYMEDHQELADQVYSSVETQVPHLEAKQIEAITIGLMREEIKEEWAELLENSNSSGHLTKIGPDQRFDAPASERQPTGGDMEKTYTEDELKATVAAAVAEAMKPVAAELETLKAQADADAVEGRIADIETAHAAAVAEIQLKLDEATIAGTAAADERDRLVAWLEGEKASAEEAALRESRTEERVAKVKEVANFSDEFIADNTERWVAMSDDDFAATVVSYEASFEAAKASLASAGAGTTETKLTTALSDTRDTAGAGTDRMASVRDVLGMRHQGVDPRTV